MRSRLKPMKYKGERKMSEFKQKIEPFVNSPLNDLDLFTDFMFPHEPMVEESSKKECVIFRNGRYFMNCDVTKSTFFQENRTGKHQDASLKVISALGATFLLTLPKIISTVCSIKSNDKS